LVKNSSDFIIIGAGVSGLTLAYELLKKGKKVAIYEKNSIPGGIARTEIVDGVSFDCGPHLYHSNNDDIKKYWKELLGDNLLTPELYGANFKDNKIYEYPLSEEIIEKQFTKDEVKLIKKQLSQRDLNKISSAKNYNEYVNILAGDFLSNLFFNKYPKKLWGIDSKNLSAKFAPRRVEIRKKSLPFHSGKNKWAAVLKGGCGTLAYQLEKKINFLGGSINYNVELTKVSFSNSIQDYNKPIDKIYLSDKNVIDCSNKTIISTIPVTNLSEIIGLQTDLWYRSIKIISILVNKKISLPDDYDWLYFDSSEVIFHRVTNQNSFSDSGIPKNSTVLSCEVAYTKADQISNLDDDVLIERVLNDLIKLDLINEDDVLKKHLIDAGFVYPGIDIGYEQKLNKLTSELDSIPNLFRHGALAEFEYSDLQVLTAKSIDLANELTKNKINSVNIGSYRCKPGNVISIDNYEISSNSYPYLIAEAGLNHNGDVNMAIELIKQAKMSGANAVKLQTYISGRISNKTRTARYYEDLVDTQESLSNFLDRIIFSKKDLVKLINYAKKIGITFFSTPFDIESFELLNSLDMPAFKISSMDIVNYPLIDKVSKTLKPIILSTGMASLSEIEEAVNIVLENNNPNLIVLHCVSSYPCPASIANLPRINKIKDIFEVIPGFSDHTTGTDVALSSVAFGARVIEKHFTLDNNLDGPDHSFSILPEEMKLLSTSLKNVSDAAKYHGLNSSKTELNTALNLRRSLFFRDNLEKDHILTAEDIIIKSPGIGLHPKFLSLIIGRKLKTNVDSDTPIDLECFH